VSSAKAGVLAVAREAAAAAALAAAILAGAEALSSVITDAPAPVVVLVGGTLTDLAAETIALAEGAAKAEAAMLSPPFLPAAPARDTARATTMLAVGAAKAEL
jgi:hypothetical protein